MKNLLLSLVMLFSITTQSQELSDELRGVWSSNRTSYYVVILHDEQKGYEVVNFSFRENQTLNEEVVQEGKNHIKTKIVNPSNGFETSIKYTFVDGELHCQFGNNDHVSVYKRYSLVTN